MYLFDFFRNVLRRSNISVIIYLIINVFIISMIIGMPFAQYHALLALGFGLLIYLFSLTIALSPIGEAILRHQTGCEKITDIPTLNYIEPVFREVYRKAKMMNPNIPDDVDLYLVDSMDVNAFATGRRTVCMTKGMMQEDTEKIKACLGHEMGHLAHHDTDLILVVTVGNLIATAFFTIMRISARICQSMGMIFAAFSGDEDGLAAALFIQLAGFLSDVLLAMLMGLWTKIGTIMVLKSGRENEYDADEFSFNLGYGRALCELLDTFPANQSKGLFANLMSSHPDKNDRIRKLRELGVNY